mmetsp:Transcript_135350/g.432099  ORF Transcript_135350/g.432099 Transcript_135350/m.432099 type:complete len:470 (-) Transcript_135350:182-1591(-)
MHGLAFGTMAGHRLPPSTVVEVVPSMRSTLPRAGVVDSLGSLAPVTSLGHGSGSTSGDATAAFGAGAMVARVVLAASVTAPRQHRRRGARLRSAAPHGIPRGARGRSTQRVAMRAAEDDLAAAQAAVDAAKAELAAARAQAEGVAVPEVAKPAPKLSQEDILAEARAAAETSKLELEVAKLRAEVQEMESVRFQERRAARAQRLIGGDGAISVGAVDLRTRLQESEGIDLTAEQTRQLVAACGRSQEDGGQLFFDELVNEKFDAELQQLVSGIRAANFAEARQQQEEAAASSKAAAAAEPQQSSEASVPENTDTSTSTRILACLVYILTLADGFRIAVPIVMTQPIIAALFTPLALVSALISAVPFGSGILFLLFVTLAQNKELPRLLRFNLEQAVLLDVALVVPNLLVVGATEAGAPDVGFVVGGVFFVALLLVVGYCWSSSSKGEEPDGIPFVSSTTKNVIDRSSFF